ncbi:hypothetical protein GR247_10235 [Rhizobium leguminosarum]|nr:hypothetical protein [Rhizobium leguminosarum]
MQPVEIRVAALIFLITVWVMIIRAAMDFFAVQMPISLVASYTDSPCPMAPRDYLRTAVGTLS